MAHVREAVYADCVELAPRLRPEDKAEVWANSRSTPLDALVDGLVHSDMCWTIIGNTGEVVGMFGVAPIPGTDAGSPWMLCSEGLVDIQRQFLRECRGHIDMMHRKYKVLWNAADIRNIVHLKWLRWCGFEFLSTYRHNETEFVQFMKIKE